MRVLGLDNLHLFTNGRKNTLRIDMKDYDDFYAYATYKFVCHAKKIILT